MTGSVRDASALFDGERLKLARELAGVSKSQLAREIEKSPASITGWEAGAKKPNAASVARLSLRLGVEPAFFISRGEGGGAQKIAPHFRSLRSTTQTSRNQARAYVQIVDAIAANLDEYIDFPEVSLPEMEITLEEDEIGVPERAAS